MERSAKSLLPCIGRSRHPEIQVPLTGAGGDALLLQDTRAGMIPALSDFSLGAQSWASGGSRERV